MTQIPTQSNRAKNGAAADSDRQPPGTPLPTALVPFPSAIVPLQDGLKVSEFDYYGAPSRQERSRTNASLEEVLEATGGVQRRASELGKRPSRLAQRWNNIGMRQKLLLLLLLSSAVPMLVMTQALVTMNRGRAIEDAKTLATQQAAAFHDEYVLWAQTDAVSRASNLARLVTATGVDINNPRSLAVNADSLKSLTALDPLTDPESAQNFQIVVNTQGRTVVQDVRLITTSGVLPVTEKDAIADVKLVPLALPLGLDLRAFPMVQKVLSTGQAAKGVESLPPGVAKSLKLNEQLDLENQLISREGHALAAISVQPILQNNRTVGAVIVGTVFNNYQLLPDIFRLRYEASAVAIFDGKQQVTTTVAGEGEQLRQTEFPVPKAVETQVLEQGKEALILGRQDGNAYLHHYSPLYDHTEGTDAATKPIGMTYVGQSLESVETRFVRQQFLAYGLGGGMLLLTALLAFPAASSITEPLRQLSGFMGRISRGDRRLRLSKMDRTDELGELSQSLNQMVNSLENNETRLQEALTRSRILAQIANIRSLDSESSTEGLQNALAEARTFVNCDRLVIYRCGSAHPEDSTVLFEAVSSDLPSAIKLKISDTCIPESVLESYRNGQCKSNPDVHKAGFGPKHLELLERLKVKASLIVPIHSNQELYGLLVAHDCWNARSWDKAEIEVMQSIASQVAVTLGYTTLLEQQKVSEEAVRADKEFFQRRALELLQEVDPVSRGDLTVRARVTEDEIGTIADSYNSTVESLRQIVTQVKAVAGQVTTTAEQNDAAVQKLATEALLQTEKIEASLAQLESMTQAVRALTEQAQAAQQAVIATTITVESGERKMTRAVEGMVTIRETVAETTRKMEDLEDASQRISQVIRLIGGFAAQTHMLAMKASIEAARAGDRGEGFAVIADEVRTLAGRSAQATADVEAIINSIRIATQDVLGAMSAENKQVEKEMELVDDTRSSLNQITAASAQVNQLVMAIAQTTRDQTQTSDAASQTITDVARLVRQTSVEANQVSETFQDLLQAAQSLESEVSRFKVQ